jgi:stearoyl-CoA desaturase (delta-9 desaturase)
MFAASALTLSIVQIITTILTILGFFYFDFTLLNILIIFIGYFLYSGVGVSMMMHRYWTHRSFEFKYKIVEIICKWFAIVAGRGSPIGWVYVHRLHHAFSDTPKDPHDPTTVGWKIFFPHLIKYGSTVNKRLINDLMTREQLYINKYYNLFLVAWASVLLLIDPSFLYFFYIIPLFLTFVSLDLFVFLTHKHGYRNFNSRDNSKNNWFISLILWGEGWHNNHHSNAANFTTKVKWWEIDPLGIIISLVKR